MTEDSAAPESTLPQSRPELKSPRILVLRAGAIGDTLMATPLVRALRQTFPKAHLVFVCSRPGLEVVLHNPHLDQVIPLAYRHLPLWISWEKLRILRTLRGLHLDWGIVLESHRSFTGLVRRTGVKRLIAYGALPGGEGFERVMFDPQRHSSENHLRAATSLGIKSAGPEMDLYYPRELDDAVRRRLMELGIHDDDCLVGIHAGWGGRTHAVDQTRLRSWPAQNFAQVIEWLARTEKARIILTGSSEDRALAEYIAARTGVPCLNLAGKLSLVELAALIRRLNAYLTVDSGPAHMAAALGTPLLTLWGPGIFEQTAPQASRGPVRILYHRVHCAPCYGTPLMKTCQDNICMKKIEVEEVVAALAELVRSAEPRERGAIPARCGPRPPA